MQLDYIYNYCEINLLLIKLKINPGGRAGVFPISRVSLRVGHPYKMGR